MVRLHRSDCEDALGPGKWSAELKRASTAACADRIRHLTITRDDTLLDVRRLVYQDIVGRLKFGWWRIGSVLDYSRLSGLERNHDTPETRRLLRVG
jgi:hypothetical protein